jgi:hypothetical protein
MKIFIESNCYDFIKDSLPYFNKNYNVIINQSKNVNPKFIFNLLEEDIDAYYGKLKIDDNYYILFEKKIKYISFFFPKEEFLNNFNNKINIPEEYVLENKLNYNHEYNQFFIKRKDIVSDFSFVLQGPDTEIGKIGMNIYFLYGKPIVSTWSQYNFNDIKKLVETKKYYNRANIYYQIYTTYQGLLKVNTKYIIKMRADEIYSNLDYSIKLIKNNPDKIICNNVYFRKSESYPYHCSDHFIGSTLKNIYEMFNGAKRLIEMNQLPYYINRSQLVPEQIITIGYLCNYYREDILEKKENQKNLMKTHFLVIPLETYENYLVITKHEKYLDKIIQISPKNYSENSFITELKYIYEI